MAVSGNNIKVLIGEKNSTNYDDGAEYVLQSQVIPFTDPSFVAGDVKSAIVELNSDTNQTLNYTYSRKGHSDTNSFLKVGNKIPSNEAGFVSPITATKLIISASCEEITTGTVLVFVKKVGTNIHISGYGGLVFTNERTKYINIPTMATTINPGDEIAVKVTSGSFENLVVHVRIIK